MVHQSTGKAWVIPAVAAQGGQLHFATVENLVYPWFQVVRVISPTHALLRIPAHPATKRTEVLVKAPLSGVAEACNLGRVENGRIVCEMHWKLVCKQLHFLPVWFTSFDTVPVGPAADPSDVGNIGFPHWLSLHTFPAATTVLHATFKKWYMMTMYARFSGAIPRMASAAGVGWRAAVAHMTRLQGAIVPSGPWGMEAMERFRMTPWLGDGSVIPVAEAGQEEADDAKDA